MPLRSVISPRTPGSRTVTVVGGGIFWPNSSWRLIWNS
jgi:hypothetical protein